uniref:SMC hinge domain-containing protein n=1 Tax=Knipowitschia caucasica TaxID=637954 RepID=A0AAV2L7V1_KNICA
MRSSRRGEDGKKLFVYDRRFQHSNRREEWLVTTELDFTGFLWTISETFSVRPNEKFLLVTTDRTVLDKDKFSRLQYGACLYMLLTEDQPLEVPAEELIFFTPHHDTILESGSYKYYESEGKKALPHALADLVDNSISATVNNTGERVIEIRLVPEDSGKASLIVLDNGCGMTSKQLNNWAVYKLSKFKRENGRFTSDQGTYARPGHVYRSINSDISYFGVGGKQAVFYIGKKVRVISKSSSYPDVHELILSKELFEKKERNKEETYETNILNRKSCDSSHIGKDERFLCDLIAEEFGQQSFTAVVITDVLPEHIRFLKEEIDVWTRQIAHIYHYYLHGPNGNTQGNVSQSSYPDSEHTSKVDIRILCKTKKYPDVFHLRDIGTDLQSLYVKAAVSTFEFKACTNPEAGLVEGVIRYHPFLYDRETYPENPDVVHDLTEEDNEDEPDMDPPSKKQKKPVFECYWNGRLIPYTTVQEFDWCSQPPKGSPVPAECYNRFSGVLFTDDTFKVTENKFTFLDLEQKMKNKDTIFTVVVKGQKQRANLQRDFVQWLQHCHEKYDKQVKFMDFKGSTTREDLATKKNQTPWATFSSVEWGGKTFKTGDYVKSLKTNPIYNGRVIRFLLFGTHDEDRPVYGCGGHVEISLEPKGLYENTKILLLSKLDQNATVEEIMANIKNEDAKLPDKLKVEWPEGNEWLDNTTITAGSVLGPIQVMVLNKKGEHISKLPGKKQSGKRLSVQLRLVHHVSNKDRELFLLEASHGSTWGYWFKEIANIVELGKYTLHLRTIVTESKALEFGGLSLPSFKLRFNIKADVADQFDVGKINSTFRLGIPFSIPLEFKDKYGHVVCAPPHLKPTLQCSGLSVTYEKVECQTKSSCHIKNVKITGKLDCHEPNCYNLKVTLHDLTQPSKTLQINLLPGAPHSIFVTPKELPIEVENGNTVKFTVFVHDESGNVTAAPNLTARCLVAQHEPATINCVTGVGEHVTAPINVSLTKGNPQKVIIRFNVPNRSTMKEVTRQLLVKPSKRVNCIKIFKADESLELKNEEKINWMAGALLENLTFKLYDECNSEVPVTAAVASKIKVNWKGKLNQQELMEGKLPDVTVPTKVATVQFYQVSYQDQSISVSFTVAPIPDEPKQLKASVPQCSAKLGEILPERITLQLVDQYENVVRALTQSCVTEMIADGEGLDKESLIFHFEEQSCSVVVTGVGLNVAAGVPAKLTLLAGQKFLNVLNGQGIPAPFIIQLCDQWGNPSPDRRVVVKLAHLNGINVSSNVSSQPVNAEGQASFTVKCVSAPKGTYELRFQALFKKEPIPGPTVNLTVLPDPNKPVSLDVHYETKATFVAGEVFPVFSVTVLSDEGSPMLSRQAVSMHYWKGEQSNTPPNTAVEFQCSAPKENDKKDRFYFREKPIPGRVGTYSIQFSLCDPKSKTTLRSDPIVVNVVANRPMKLGPESPPETQVVSCSNDIAKRILVEDMTLVIMDQYDNPAGQNLNGDVLICIKNLDNNSQEPIPLFDDNTNNCLIKLENGTARVSKLAIQKKSPGKHGLTYRVVFTPQLASNISTSLESYVFEFCFSNDEENQKEHKALRREGERIKEAIMSIKKKDKIHENLIKEYKVMLQRLCEQEAAIQNELRIKWNMNVPENIETLDNMVITKRHEASNILHRPRRAYGKSNDFTGPDVLGRVGHLALVSDDSAAWVISWHIRGDMDCVITTTTAAARRIYDQTKGRQQVMPIDAINNSCRRPLQPLPHIRHDRELFQPTGRPMYAIDALTYTDPKNQEQCATVFRNVLGNVILIDDLDSGSLYRQNAVKCNVMCPTILTRQGERISGKGKFGGAQNRAPPPHTLDMFGAPLPDHFHTIQQIIVLLEKYKEIIGKKDSCAKDIAEITPKMRESRESLGSMTRQLQEIQTQIDTPLRPKRECEDGCGEMSDTAAKRTKFGP